eukprot:3408-Eustigmatos_ZCMA.PRE.1
MVLWKRSRSFFYWRAKRRIAEDGLVRKLQDAAGGKDKLTNADARARLSDLAQGAYADDQAFLSWVQD